MNPNDIRFQDAIPPMPPSFYERMQTTMEGMEEPMKKRYKLTSVLIAAIVAALLLAGAAVAAMQSDLLRNLFPGGAPPEAEGLLIQDELSTEKEGVKLTIGEHLYDGRNFHLNWTVESTRDDTVFYSVNYRMRYPDGTPVDISQWSGRRSSMDQGAGTLTALNLTLDDATSPKSFSGYTSNGFMADEMPTKPWVYTLVVDVYTTDLVAVACDDAAMLSEEEYAEYSRNRQLPIEQGQFGCIDSYPEFLAIYENDFFGPSFWEETTNARIEAHNQCGLLNHVASLSILIQMDPGAAKGAKIARLDQPTTLQFKDMSVIFDAMEIDLSGIHTAYRIPSTDVQGDHFEMIFEFLILDQDGNLLSEGFAEMGGTYSPDEVIDGISYMVIESGGGSVSELPTELTFLRMPKAMQEMEVLPLAEVCLAYLNDHPEERDEATLTLTIE